MTGLSLLLLAGVLSWRNERTAVEVFVLGATAMLLLAAWLVVHASTTTEYLAAVFTSRIGWLIDVLRAEGDGIREIYGGQTPPLGERIVAAIYPLLVAVLCGAGARGGPARSAPPGATAAHLSDLRPDPVGGHRPDPPRRRLGPRVPALAVPLLGRSDLRGAGLPPL